MSRSHSCTPSGRGPLSSVWPLGRAVSGGPCAKALEQLGVAVNANQAILVARRDAQRQPGVTAAHARRNTQAEAFTVLHDRIGIYPQSNTLTAVDFGEGGMLCRLTQPVVGASQRGRSIDRHAGVIGGQSGLLAG